MSKRKKNRYAIQPAESSPKSLPMPSRYSTREYRLVQVFVEGYDDVAFWRGIFDDYETEWLKFEISVPPRQDLAKGKKVLLGMIGECCDDRILCVDSDFDYLFEDFNEQSRQVNRTPYLFHTYAYATENYLCWPASLHKVCVKATKNDTMIFDFERFMGRYSRAIYPLFLWYAYSARRKSEKAFTLVDFRSSVRLNYLDIREDGQQNSRMARAAGLQARPDARDAQPAMGRRGGSVRAAHPQPGSRAEQRASVHARAHADG